METVLRSRKGEINILRAKEKVRVRNVARLAQVNGVINSALKENEMREFATRMLDGLRKLKEEG